MTRLPISLPFKRSSDSVTNQSMALGHELLPETCLCRPWCWPKWPTQAPHWSACAWGEGTIISLKPCFPVDSSVTNHFCRPAERARVSPFTSRQAVWLHGFPIHQTAAAQTRYVVTCSSTGFMVSRFTSREHHVCNSGPVSLHNQAVAPTVGSGRFHRTDQAFKTWSLETLNCLFGI